MRVREKKHRLPDAAYRGIKTVAFTGCIEDRQRPFERPEISSAFIGMLEAIMPQYRCVAPAYCFMPDHLHVVVSGCDSKADAKAAIEHFKHISGNWFFENAPPFHWQGNFYDHIVRNQEDLASQVRYVLANPIRAGLVAVEEDYPFLGSVGVDLAEYLLDLDMGRKFGRRS